jgi:hypothetical protein
MVEQYLPSIARSLTQIVHCTKVRHSSARSVTYLLVSISGDRAHVTAQDARYLRWAQRTLGLPAAGDHAGDEDTAGSDEGGESQDGSQSVDGGEGGDGEHPAASVEAMRRRITDKLRGKTLINPVHQLMSAHFALHTHRQCEPWKPRPVIVSLGIFILWA